MKLFITVSEDYYGGGDSVQVYSVRADAEEYIRTRTDGKDWKIVVKECDDANFVMVLLSEDFYGGDETTIRVFLTGPAADECRDKLWDNDKSIDYTILGRDVL